MFPRVCLSYWKEMIDPIYDAVERAPRQEGRIMWMGGASNVRFFEVCSSALQRVHRAGVKFKLVTVCPRVASEDNAAYVDQLPFPTEFVDWTPKSVVREMGLADLAVIPLSQTEWCRCKSPNKMVTFQACGVPVIATRMPQYESDASSSVVERLNPCLLPVTAREWESALVNMLGQQEYFQELAGADQERVKKAYSPDAVCDEFIEVLRKLGVM
jgi:hypothetical protein